MVKHNNREKEKTPKYSILCVAITCSHKPFCSFCELSLLFFPGGGVKWGVSRVGRVQTDTKEEGWKFICPGQRGGLDRDRPDELQSSFNSFQLSVYTEKTPKKHPGYSHASPCETVLYVRCNKMKTYSLSDTRWWRPWRSGGPVGASIQVESTNCFIVFTSFRM